MKCALKIIPALVSVLLLAQPSVTKYVVLSHKSNIGSATVSDGLAKLCPGVVVTDELSKANYVLEALETRNSADEQHSLWHFALLSKDGDLLMATHFSPKSKYHFDSICKYITKAARHNSR